MHILCSATASVAALACVVAGTAPVLPVPGGFDIATRTAADAAAELRLQRSSARQVQQHGMPLSSTTSSRTDARSRCVEHELGDSAASAHSESA
jgi:hypothetical protein